MHKCFFPHGTPAKFKMFIELQPHLCLPFMLSAESLNLFFSLSIFQTEAKNLHNTERKNILYPLQCQTVTFQTVLRAHIHITKRHIFSNYCLN